MSKKVNTKKIMMISVGVVVAIIAVIALVLMITAPYRGVKNALDYLKNSNYTFEARYNVNYGFSEQIDNLKYGEIKGEKQKDVLYANVIVFNEKYLEVYAQSPKLVLNITPLLERALQKLDETVDLPLGLFSNVLKDIYISNSQLREIAGEDLFGNNLEGLLLSDNYDMKKVKKPQGIPDSYNHSAYYFKIEDNDSDLELILAVPKDAKCHEYYVQASRTSFSATAIIDCTKATRREIVVPDGSLSDGTVEFLRTVAGWWRNFTNPWAVPGTNGENGENGENVQDGAGNQQNQQQNNQQTPNNSQQTPVGVPQSIPRI